MGVERESPDVSEESRLLNFTNEGGYGGSYRFLKNIMGLWIIQSLKRESGLSFDAIMQAADSHLDTPLRFDVDGPSLLSPDSMTAAVRALLGHPAGLTDGEMFAAVYLSLSDCYARTLDQIRARTGRDYPCLHVIGGGSRDRLLCRLTAKSCGIPVIAGPSEATAMGNLLCQMISGGEFPSVVAARTCLSQSGLETVTGE